MFGAFCAGSSGHRSRPKRPQMRIGSLHSRTVGIAWEKYSAVSHTEVRADLRDVPRLASCRALAGSRDAARLSAKWNVLGALEAKTGEYQHASQHECACACVRTRVRVRVTVRECV
eukprot:7861041-Pyramimonas_sp.AAC.1